MFKKTLLVGAIALAASSVALADGFYAGAGLGGTGFHDQMGSDDDQGNLGVIGGVFGGYTWNFANQFNLGAEAFGNATSAKAEILGVADVKSRYNYGVRALPGYQVTPDTEVHAIVGFVRGNFKVEQNAGSFSQDKTFNANGFQLGLGTGTNVAKNIAVRGDLVYSGYQSKTVSDADGDSFKNKINTLDGIVSVAYKFG